MAIDTLKVAKRLREAGFTEPQAEAVVAAAADGDQAMVVQLSPLTFEGAVARRRPRRPFPTARGLSVARSRRGGRASLLWPCDPGQFRAGCGAGRQDPAWRQPGRAAIRT